MTSKLLTLACAGAVSAFLVPVAVAGTARVDAGVLTAELVFQDFDESSETATANNVTVSFTGTAGQYRITDTAEGITAGAGCVAVSGDPNSVLCTDIRINHIKVDVGRLNDVVTVTSATSASIFGGNGADILTGGAGNDVLRGDYTEAAISPGSASYSDTLNGNGGNDVLWSGRGSLSGPRDALLGGSGNDELHSGDPDDSADAKATFFGGPGADVLIGGKNDVLDYSGHGAGVNVSTNGIADDGSAGEGDDVRSIRPDTNFNGFGQIIGSDFADNLEGDAGADVIDGRRGPDTVSAGIGDDTLIDSGPAGAGQNDVLDAGGSGNDTVDYSARSESLSLSLDGVANDGAAAEGDNILNADNLIGGANGDELSGNGDKNQLEGRGGPDLLREGGGAGDVLYGGAGQDAADYRGRTENLNLTLNGCNFELIGALDDGAPNEKDCIDVEDVEGGNGDDTIVGDAGANFLRGNGGNDVVRGGAGNDLVLGEAGSDTMSYADHSASVTASLAAGAGGPAGEADTLAGVENLVGTPAADSLTGDDAANRIEGGAGSDTVVGRGGSDVLVGGPETLFEPVEDDDTLDGGAGNDSLMGGWDADVLKGGPGADTHGGGNGVDTISYVGYVDTVNVSLDGVANDGTPDFGEGFPAEGDNADPNGDVENVTGGGGDDTIAGSAGDNTIDGGPGADAMSGGGGGDTVVYTDHIRLLFSGCTGSTITLDGIGNDGADAYDTAFGSFHGSPADNVGSDIENVVGSTCSDAIVGNANANSLSGAGGNDLLDGGLGPDTLSGGDGVDTADYSARTSSVTVDMERDCTADLDGVLVSCFVRAGDGETGEGDSVDVDVENVRGGSGDDTLRGGIVYVDDFAGAYTIDDYANTLEGNAGNDTLDGRGGADSLNGGSGAADVVTYAARSVAVTVKLDGAANDGAAGENDNVIASENVTGGAGDDIVVGDGNANALTGGPGNDTVTGGAGIDSFDAGDGDDILNSRDSAEESAFDCGPGADTVVADSADRISAEAECELVQVEAPDTTPPAITPNVLGPLGANGWYTGDVTVTWSIVDAQSAVSSSTGCASTTISTDTAGTTVTCSATSAGGTASNSVTVRRDGTAPTNVETKLARLPDHGGWYNAPVGWTTTGDDATSGIASCDSGTYGGPDSTSLVPDLSVSGGCTDNAGNSSAEIASVPFKYDDTDPGATTQLTRLPDHDGWYTSSVAWAVSCADEGSGIAGNDVGAYSGPDGNDVIVAGRCWDNAGNYSALDPSDPFDYDATAPTIAGSVNPAPNANGWNSTPVTVSFSCSDGASGIASCEPDKTLAVEGANQSVSGEAADNAGHTGSTTLTGIDIDLTRPSVSLVGGPTDGATYDFGSVPAQPTCVASDVVSGIDGSCSVSGYSASPGTHAVIATAKDKAGNEASASRTYTVRPWTLLGFYQPTDMRGVLNVVKNGATVPLRFELFAGPTELADTSNVRPLTAAQITCEAAATIDAIEVTATGATALRYDTVIGEFVYNWHTPKKPGNCYRVTVTTQDGSSLAALFKLK